MKNKPTSCILFFVASILAIFAVVIKNETLIILTKPIILSSISFYYFQLAKNKINWLFVIVLVCSFTTYLLITFNLFYNGIPTAIIGIIIYLIFIYFSIKDVSISKINWFKFFNILIIISGTFMILKTVLGLITNANDLLFQIYILYGIILSLFAILTIYNYINNQNLKSYFALILCICFVIMDVFYIINNFYIKMDVFVVFHEICLFASYYYMVMYIVTENVTNNKEEF